MQLTQRPGTWISRAQRSQTGRARTARAAVREPSAPPTDDDAGHSRRQVLLWTAALAGVAQTPAGPALAGDTSVGSYLPAAGLPDFPDLVRLTPSLTRTPALRAGVIQSPYTFAMLPSFSEAKLSNVLTGNFCMPNCGEPWTEAIFSSPEGYCELLATNLVKLTNKKGATVEDLGPPQSLLQRLGPYITGTYLDEDDVLGTRSQVQDDGRAYYYFEVNAQGYGTKPPHAYAAATTKEEVAYLFIASASEKQWPKQQKRLRAMVESFRA